MAASAGAAVVAAAGGATGATAAGAAAAAPAGVCGPERKKEKYLIYLKLKMCMLWAQLGLSMSFVILHILLKQLLKEQEQKLFFKWPDLGGATDLREIFYNNSLVFSFKAWVSRAQHSAKNFGAGGSYIFRLGLQQRYCFSWQTFLVLQAIWH